MELCPTDTECENNSANTEKICKKTTPGIYDDPCTVGAEGTCGPDFVCEVVGESSICVKAAASTGCTNGDKCEDGQICAGTVCPAARAVYGDTCALARAGECAIGGVTTLSC